MKLSIQNLFLLTLGITVFARFSAIHEWNLLHTFVLVMYIAIWGLYLIRNPFKFSFRNYSVIYLELMLYFIVFAILNHQTQDKLAESLLTDTLQSLLMCCFMIITTFMIKKLNCLDQSISAIYKASLSFLSLCFIIYVHEVNLINTLSTFWISNRLDRSYTLFGFSAPNLAAEGALFVILLSLYKWNKLRTNISIKRMLIVLSDIMMLLIIIGNNSRGTVVDLLLLLFVFLVLRSVKSKNYKRITRLIVFFIVIAVFLLYVYLQANKMTLLELLTIANRNHLYDNLQVLFNSGRLLTGIGSFSGNIFKSGYSMYGWHLNYMEMFYVGVFVKTGIFGSIVILSIIVKIFKGIVKAYSLNSCFEGKWYILIFAHMIIVSFFETYLFSHSYITSTCLLIILISYLDISAYEGKMVKKSI